MSRWRRAREIGSFAVIAAFFLMTTATSKPKKDSSSSGGVNARPADLDLTSMNGALGCSRSSFRPGCRLLTEFEDADPWFDIPSIETVYYGEITGIGNDMDGRREFYFLQIGSISPNVFTGSARELFPENQKERNDATNLLSMTKIGGSVPNSEAARFMRTAVPSDGRRTLVLTRGKSYNLSGTITHFRRKGSRLLVAEYSGLPLGDPKRPGRAANAWVGELFKLSPNSP